MKDLNLIELTNLEKRYGKKEALNGVNLTIGRGKIIGLLGPNGSGKTTLIKLLNGLLQPTSGEIKVNGKAPGVDSKKIMDEVIFIKEGSIVTYKSADDLREESGKSIDALFREIFHTDVYRGGDEAC